MHTCLDQALALSGKRLSPSSVAVYQSHWKALCEALSAQEGPFMVEPDALRRALRQCGTPGTQKRLLQLFRWVSLTLAPRGVRLGDAYLCVSPDYADVSRPAHLVAQCERTARDLETLATELMPGWKGARLAAIISILRQTGIRREEVLGLTHKGLYCDRDVPGLCVGQGARRRTLPLGAAVFPLRAWLTVNPWPHASLVFPAGDHDKPMDASTLWRQLRRLEEITGPADKILSGPTAFRAGVAHRLQKQGCTVAEIQRALGHRLSTSTEDLLRRV